MALADLVGGMLAAFEDARTIGAGFLRGPDVGIAGEDAGEYSDFSKTALEMPWGVGGIGRIWGATIVMSTE